MSSSKGFALTGALGCLVIIVIAFGVQNWPASSSTGDFVSNATSVGKATADYAKRAIGVIDDVASWFRRIVLDFKHIFQGEWGDTLLVLSFKYFINEFTTWLNTWWQDMWTDLLDTIKEGKAWRVTIPMLPWTWFLT